MNRTNSEDFAFSSFSGKKVLVTGHTGFKGSWLTIWLEQVGAEVVGFGLEPTSSPSLFSITKGSRRLKDIRGDIRNQEAVSNLINLEQPDFVFHLAAQSLVRKSYNDASYTWETNLMGTINVLEALKQLKKKCVAVFITSDKCYKNVEWVWGYRENDILGGEDPYSASKASAEMAIHSYVKSFFQIDQSPVRIATARAGNVIGGGDWSEDRVVPDCVRSWSINQSATLRNPSSTRPWQHVLEPLSGYLSLAEQLWVNVDLHGESFNFGPNSNVDRTVADLVLEISKYWLNLNWEIDINAHKIKTEAGLLKLNCDKAGSLLNWKPVLQFEETAKMTAEWYKSFYELQSDMQNTCIAQIRDYIKFAKVQQIEWANL
jgi:CDP-glucose 4,6-dehydratase